MYTNKNVKFNFLLKNQCSIIFLINQNIDSYKILNFSIFFLVSYSQL